MSYRTQTVRELRTSYLSARARRDELYLREQEDPDFGLSDAEAQQDAREEANDAERELLSYVVRGVAAHEFSDPRYAAELALGEHDDDLG